MTLILINYRTTTSDLDVGVQLIIYRLLDLLCCFQGVYNRQRKFVAIKLLRSFNVEIKFLWGFGQPINSNVRAQNKYFEAASFFFLCNQL